MNPILTTLLAFILTLALAACDSQPPLEDIHRQGKVPDGGMGPASGGN